jgi:hypothetical protein
MTPQENLRRALLNDEFPDDAPEDRLFSPTGTDALRQNRNIALSAWMTQVSGQDINAGSPTWQHDKDALAQGFFKIPTAKDITDEAIHDLVRSHIQTSDSATDLALESALSGRPLPQALGELNSLTGVSKTRGIRDRYMKEAASVYSGVAAKVAPYRGIINEAASVLSKEMDFTVPTTDAFQSVAEKLLQVPEQDRRLVIKAIGATGGATAEERSSYLSKLAGAMGRMSEQMGSSIESAMSESALTETVAQLQEAGQMGFARQMEGEIGRQSEFRILTQMVRDTADSEISPIKGEGRLSKLGIDLARMIPQSAVSIANPAMGLAANVAYFDATQTAQIMREDPSLSMTQARAITAISAPVSAAAETVATLIPFGKVKLPYLSKWVQSMVASSGAGWRNLALRAGAGTAAEVTEEYIQAAAPLVTQDILSALSKDMPKPINGADWESRMPKFSEIAEETWGPALVFSLIGGGAASINDIKGGRALASDLDLLIARGTAPELAAKIKEASDAGDYRKVDSLFREEFVSDVKASKPDIQAATERLKARFQDQSSIDALQDVTSPEYTASVTRTTDGWQVRTGDGTIIPVDSVEAANQIYSKLRQVGSQQEADKLVGVIDGYYKKGRQAKTVLTGEKVEASEEFGVVAIRRDASGAIISQRQLGPQALETVRAEAEVAGIKTGTRGVFAHINGSNEVFPMRVADGAKEIVRIMNLYKSQDKGQPQVFTFLHENFESTWRLGIENGTFSDQETRTAMRALLPAFEGVTALNAEEAQFIDNLRTLASGQGNETMLRETVSEMVMRDVLGRDRQGLATGMEPGSISRAIEASVMGANTQEEASALKRILAVFRAFSAYLKGVFSTVKAITKARDEGKLGEEYDTFINKVLGIDEVKQMKQAAVEEGKAMLGIDEEVQAVIDNGNMAFSVSSGGLSEAEAPAWPYDGKTDWTGKSVPEEVVIYRANTFDRGTFWSSSPSFVSAFSKSHDNAPIRTSKVRFNKVLDLTGVGSNPVDFIKRLEVQGINPDEPIQFDPRSPAESARQMSHYLTEDDPDRIFEIVDRAGPHWNRQGWQAVKFYETYDGNPGRTYHVLPEFFNLESSRAAGGTFSISPVTPEQDAEYLALAKEPEKNRTLLQKMVDAVAKAAGYNVEPVWHGSNSPFNIFDKKKAKEGRFGKGFYFTPDKESAKNYGNESVRVRGGELTLRQFYLKDDTFNYKDAIRVAFDPSQIKSADPVTYDNAGNVIPLSQRFNPETPNINFSISPIRNLNELSDQVERNFAENPAGALEVKSRVIRQFAKLADKWSNERWTPQGNKIRPISEKRTVKSLDKEQAMRQAQREVELVNEGMDKLTPDTLMAYSEGVGTLQDDPLIAKMLNDNGKLMSKATAEREGRNIKDQYDDAGWIPPQWYAKAGGIMPDVMANNLGFDYASEMWAALESSIKSHRNAKADYAKAEAAVKAVEKAAFEQARQEAQAWRDEADAMQKEDWSPRESLVRDLITLEAIVAMFPQEIRGKIGGFVTLARKASESARLKVLQRQLERGQELLEKHLKEQYGTAVDKLLERYQSKRDSSGRISGKILSTATEQVDYAAEFINLDIASQAKEQAALEKQVEESESAEEVQDALTKLGIARLFEVWSTKDSASRESAFLWLNETIEQGKQGKKLLDEERKAFLDDMRQSGKSSILQGDELNPAIADNLTNLNKGVMRRALLGMRGFLSESLWTTLQRLELIFGEDSKILDYFAGKIINAANLSTDIKRMVEAQKKEALSIIFNSDSKFAHARGIAELQKMKDSGVMISKVTKKEIKLDIDTLTKLADGTMDAKTAGLEQAEVDAALEEFAANARKRTVTIEKVTSRAAPTSRTMSETQGIQWWLWSMQDASRKQMELDGWDADSFAQLEKFLSPEAKALGRWISGSYQDAAGMIDPIYRKLFNAPLPRIKNYSPIYRRNMNAGGDVMDLDSSDMNSGLAAGFTKSRVNTTASLVESDALAVFLAHWENVSHWVAHAELMRDMKAILLDKDTAVAIRQKKNEGYLQRLKQDISTIESNGTSAARELVDISRMWRWFMQFRAYKGLAFRISPIIKQTPAMLNPLLADVPAHNYMMGLSRAFIEPQAFASEVSAMWKSDIIRRRIESGFSAESRVAMQGTSMTGSQAILAMQTGMMPMQMVDGGWTALGAAISFDYYRRGYMRDNPQMTPEIADSKAIARVEKMIATSAQPSDIYARSLRERSGNLFMRGLAMFVSETRKTLAIELMAIRRLATGKSKNKALDIQRFLVAHFVMAGVSQLSAMVIASLLGDDEDRDREWSAEQWTLALALGPVNGMFVFGKLIDRGGRFLINSDFYQERFGTGQKLSMFPDDNLSEKAFTDVYKAVVNVNDLFNPEDPDDFMNEIDNVSSAVGAAASTFFGPAGGAVDVGANVLREARKIQERLSE